MSSATSIDKSLRVKPEPTRKPGSAKGAPQMEDPTVDNGFKAWHFFVLASLTMATVAVVMSRQATPEHLVLISLTIGAAGAAAAAFYRMLAPLAADDASAFREPLSERARAALEREKSLVLRSIKELEFDRAMGKLSPRDFDEMAGRLRARAIMLMKQLDEGGTAYRELIERELAARSGSRRAGTQLRGPAVPAMAGDTAGDTAPVTPGPLEQAALDTCGSCGTTNDPDAAFCKRCGSKLRA